jgi:hypothetical protein
VQHHPTVPPDGGPYVTTSALCEAGRHARCRGVLVSLLAEPGTRCGCRCHAVALPAAWQATTTDRPPCELDHEGGAA